MKKCYTCALMLNENQFNKNKSRSDGLNSICKDCSQKRSRQYYQENKEEHKVTTSIRKNAYRKIIKEKVLNYLLTHPCVDCGITDILVLEFDHQHSKTNNISSMLGAGNAWASIEKEISKCEIRCANCHRRRTYLNSDNYRSRFAKK